MEKPFFEMPARLGWRKRYREIIFYPGAPSLSFSLAPAFPGCGDKLDERGIVWDLWRLMESVRRPGAYSILNCECGYPPDADLETHVIVSHPDHGTVVWELDCRGLSPALDDAFVHLDSFLRLVFEREAYEAEVRAMLREVQQTARTPVPVVDLSEAHGFGGMEKKYPGCRFVADYIFEPTVHGNCDAEEFCALDAEAGWLREPLFVPGTLLEIGFFGDELLRIDGCVHHDWIGHWFTRWEALVAFNQWMSCVSRRFALPSKGVKLNMSGDANEFVLLPGQDAENCHRSGESFVEVLRRCLGEGKTAPGVEVRYVRCEAPTAGTGFNG